MPRRGLPPGSHGTTTVRALRSEGASVTRGDVLLPALVLREEALAHNLALMASYARAHDFLLAPHGKTTLAPQLLRRQLDAGAWGITVANVSQAAVAVRAGAERVLVANEVVARADAAVLARELHAGREMYCLADSVHGVALLDTALHDCGASEQMPPLRVLVELGFDGGRSGARTLDRAIDVASAVAGARHLRLAGVEGYEGGIGSDRSDATLDKVDAYLAGIRRLAAALGDYGLLRGPEPAIVSAGGSKYFDRVAAVLGERSAYGALEVRLVVRAGCYLTHDHGVYATASPLAGDGTPGKGLEPALEAWAEVLSVPEPGLAIVGIGKRDVPYDLGLPVPIHVARGRGPVEGLSGARLVALDDQHGYLRRADGAGGGGADDPVGSLTPGDRVGFGLSHPCTAFDKWELVPVVDGQYRIVDVVRTFFG